MLDNPNMNYLHLMLHTKRHPCAILLLVQLLGMLLYPFIENTEAGHIGFNVFGIVVLGITTRMVWRTPGLVWISASIAGTKPPCAINTPNKASASGRRMSARGDQEPSI